MTDLERLGRHYGEVRQLEYCRHTARYQCWDDLVGYYEFCSDCWEPLDATARMVAASIRPFFMS